MVRRSPWKQKIPGSNPAGDGIFWGSSHTSDFNIGTPVATLPGAWRYRISAGTGRPGVSILWMGEMESLIATSISVWQHIKLSEQICPWNTLACCWDVKQPTNKHSAVLPAGSLVFAILGESFAYMTLFSCNHRGHHISSLLIEYAECVLVSSIQPSRTWMSGSFHCMFDTFEIYSDYACLEKVLRTIDSFLEQSRSIQSIDLV